MKHSIQTTERSSMRKTFHCAPPIMAFPVVSLPAGGSRSGNFYTDEQVLAAAGVTDFSPYSLGAPEAQLVPDIFL